MSMALWDKKKQMQTIMSRRRSKDGAVPAIFTPMKNEEVKTEEGLPDPRHIAAQDMMSALNEKSSMKLMDAMSNFIELHKAHAESPETPAEENGPKE